MVNIDLEKINDKLPSDLKTALSKHPYGKIIDYKITDGTNIGVILKLNSGKKVWFFQEEISDCNSKTDIESFISEKGDEVKSTTYTKNLLYVFNPLNLINWSLNSFKDVF